ncbi:PDR/VanB family oxidoreductase [Mycolicibacterium thermoresistibile]
MDLELHVVQKRTIADQIVELVLADPNGGALPEWTPGAHIDLQLGDQVRQYSLTGLEASPDRWVVCVLREPNSRGGSKFVHDQVAEGSSIWVSLPRNHFPLRTDAEHILFVAGGIGVTPMLPMISELEQAERSWSLVYCGRSRTSMAYLDELAKFGDRVMVRPDDEYGAPSLVDLIEPTAPDTVVYTCGPEGMLSALETICADPAHPRTLVLERFVPKVYDTDGDSAFEVEFAQSGVTVTVPADRSILEVAEEVGVDILMSCSEGTCGTCESPVLEGIPEHRDSVLTEEERESGTTLMPCVSRARSARLVLDL